MIPRTETVVVEGLGRFQVLRCPLGDSLERTASCEKGDSDPCKGDRQPCKLPEEQILTVAFSFSLPDQDSGLQKIIGDKRLPVDVAILPDNLPSGMIDIPTETVRYEIALESDGRSLLPGRRVRIAYGTSHKAYPKSYATGQHAEPDSIGDLCFERDRDDAMWIDLGLLDCLAPDRWKFWK
jgi:hypothetical protein